MGVFRNSAGFGKRIEYYIIGLMLKEGLDVYLPVVDDDAIDAVIKRTDNSFIAVQIKARSATAKFPAYFSALIHEYRDNYYFVFYSEVLDTIWILSSKEFIAEAYQNKSGKLKGARSIEFAGTKKGAPYCNPKYEKYIDNKFSRLKNGIMITDKPLKVEGEASGKRPIDSLYRSGCEYYFLDTGWVGTATHPAHCIGKLTEVDREFLTFTDDEGRDFYVSPIDDKDVEGGMPMLDFFYRWKQYLKEKHPNADGADYVKCDQRLKVIEIINDLKGD